MTEVQIEDFLNRIDQVSDESKALFGKMNANQMICHCTDFFRLAKGDKKALEDSTLSSKEIINIAKSGKTAPTPKGFGQVEGNGTLPNNLESDKLILKKHLLEFSKFPEEFDFALHPYFGKMDRKHWIKLATYHLDHHLKQFGV